jgi:hypothetical protein
MFGRTGLVYVPDGAGADRPFFDFVAAAGAGGAAAPPLEASEEPEQQKHAHTTTAATNATTGGLIYSILFVEIIYPDRNPQMRALK